MFSPGAFIPSRGSVAIVVYPSGAAYLRNRRGMFLSLPPMDLTSLREIANRHNIPIEFARPVASPRPLEPRTRRGRGEVATRCREAVSKAVRGLLGWTLALLLVLTLMLAFSVR